MSVGALFLQSRFAEAYVSARTHIKASRLYEIDPRTISRPNADLPHSKREPRKFIVREYRIDDEIATFRELPANPEVDSRLTLRASVVGRRYLHRRFPLREISLQELEDRAGQGHRCGWGIINRADLCCVWGNTLLSCLLGGDDS